MEELSPEDALRLQVLLQNGVQAVRLDESFVTLYGLTESGEASIPLSPIGNTERYMQAVRAVLSEHALGTPGGYPLYLKRWTRMGQTVHSRLDDLLLLGEAEAVMAVANAPGISFETAQRTWWCATNTEQQPEIAKFLLERDAVQGTDLSAVLVEFLLEYIPFIEDQAVLLSTVVIILKTDMLSPEKRENLWARSQAKTVYLIGFIVAAPTALPQHTLAVDKSAQVQVMESSIAQLLINTLALPGQNFLHHCLRALDKVPSEDAIYPLLNMIGQWFAPVRQFDLSRHYLDFIDALDTAFATPTGEMADFLAQQPKLKNKAYAACVLAGVHEGIVFEAILHTGAVGSQLRKRIKPIADFIREQMVVLTG